MLEPITLLLLGTALKGFLTIRECRNLRAHCTANAEANGELCDIDAELYVLEEFAWCSVQSKCGSLTLDLAHQSQFEEWFMDPQLLKTEKKQKFIELYHKEGDGSKLAAISYLKNQTLHKIEQTPSMFEFSYWDRRRPNQNSVDFQLGLAKSVIASYFDVLYRLMEFGVTKKEIYAHQASYRPNVQCESTEPPNIGQPLLRQQLKQIRAKQQKEDEVKKEKQEMQMVIVCMVVAFLLVCGLCGVCVGVLCGAAVSFFGLQMKV